MPSSWLRTWASDGLVSVLPSGKSRVGTVWLPPLTLMTKAAAVKTGPAYSHPMFTIGNTMQSNINAFVQDAITKYNAKTCGQ